MGKSVFIVGGGPSLKEFDFSLLRERDVISVNKSIFDVPWCKYFITMDFTFLKKIDSSILYQSSCSKVFVCNLAFPYLLFKDGRLIDTRSNLVYRLSGFDVVVHSKRISPLGLSFSDFCNGENSGFCALQLAILLGYDEIYLLGFDLTSQTTTHYHSGYGEERESFDQKLSRYYQNFVLGINFLKSVEGPRVISCSQISRLNNFLEYKPMEEAVSG